MKTLLFTNWTDENFTGIWDKIGYEIKVGMSIHLEDWKAEHFAKHLVDRELNKMGRATSDPLRKSLIAKCFGEVKEVKSETDIINDNKKIEEDIKEDVKIDKRTKEYKESIKKEEEFEGLKDKK